MEIESVGENEWRVQSVPERPKYQVLRSVRGGSTAWFCACPDWSFRGAHDPSYLCKHLKALLVELEAGRTLV